MFPIFTLHFAFSILHFSPLRFIRGLTLSGSPNRRRSPIASPIQSRLMPRTKIILSYFLSGALHASVAGAVLVGGWGGAFVLPSYSVQGGGAGPSLSSYWAPELISPLDEGPLVSLSGFADGTDAVESSTVTVRFVDSTAVEVLRSQPSAEVIIEPPQPLEVADDPAESLSDDAVRFAAIAPPIRLDEEHGATPVPPKPERPEPDSTPPTAPKPLPVEAAADARDSKIELALKTERASQPGTETARRLGAESSDADQGRSSAASLANAASDLPPGAKVDQQPSFVGGNQAPKYPDAAYQQGHQGVVELIVDVSARGTATRVRLHKTSGHALLDQAALETVQHWRFQPATYQTRPVNARVRVPVRFEITQ